MTLDTIRGALFPTLEDVEPRFREEIERVAVIGVRAIAAVCIGAPLFMYALGVLLLPSFPTPTLVIADFVGFLVGAAALAVSFWRDLRPHARWLGFVLGATTALVQTIGTTSAASFQWEVLKTTPEAQFPTIFGIVILIGVAVLPLKPVHTLTLGIFMLGLFTIAIYVRHGLAGLQGWSLFPLIVSALMLAIALGLTTVMYRVRASAFLARLRAEESFLELRKAQASLLLERTAASQSRFAAALSHELNSPLGSLASAFETLARLVEELDFDPRDPRRKDAVEDAMRSGRASYGRLNTISQRMRNLTNLDRAEERLIDLNSLCSDTVEFLGSELGNARVEMRLAPLPRVKCRPQQIGAVLANLVRNASSAIDAHVEGKIEVVSLAGPARVVVEVKDNGRGIEAGRLATLFEPSFGVDGGRVATTNWGLFISRSIVSEHRGSLEIESSLGRGTTARVSLPRAS
jgi:signal transduction histidine kinase